MNKVLDGIEASEFDELLDYFIDSEDPNMMSFEAFDEAVNLQLDEMAALEVELTLMQAIKKNLAQKRDEVLLDDQVF